MLACSAHTCTLRLHHPSLYLPFTFPMAHSALLPSTWRSLVCASYSRCSETIGYICAIGTPDSKIGVGVLTLIMVVLFSFSGWVWMLDVECREIGRAHV